MKKILFIVFALFALTATADQYYQDASSNLYFLSTQDIANGGVRLLPVNSVPISDAQATAIQAAQAASAAAAALLLPNPTSFTAAVKSAVGGILGANTLMVAYPAFFPAIQSNDWQGVQDLIIEAQSKSVITPAQYQAIKAAAQATNIPLSLP